MMRRDKNTVDHYQVLGLARGVSASDIKIAYRAMVRSCHPDLSFNDANRRKSDTERMMALNAAYEVLIDEDSRREYDRLLSKSNLQRFTTGVKTPMQDSLDEEKAREKYLRYVFNPHRRSIEKALTQYKKRLSKLAEDLYDETELEEFANYVQDIDTTLRQASTDLSRHPAPASCKPALQWLRHAIAQAADGLEELNYFCGNYDYDHLAMADNLFKIAREHLKTCQDSLRSCQSA
ncbi:MAG: J domain-containing protein [Candidatus Melainabacteria bacterium]|jgi:molecular chaperone DnaJ|nr:J domain-containing protein [Candidatus Melainabacteria bacterium]MBX9674815.1 J domain-containing protein [Candidatus Obscuribacterales bacterium]